MFHARLDSRLPIRIDPIEHDDWGWFPLAEAFEKIRWTDDREALERLRFEVPPRQKGVSRRDGMLSQP